MEVSRETVGTTSKHMNQNSSDGPGTFVEVVAADKQSPAIVRSSIGTDIAAHTGTPIKRDASSDVSSADRVGSTKQGDKTAHVGSVAVTDSVLLSPITSNASFTTLSPTSVSPLISNRDAVMRSGGAPSTDAKPKPSWHTYLDKLSNLN